MNLKIIRSLGISVSVLALVGVFAGAAYGQTVTGTLTGTLTDPKGLAMSGANILVHNDDTGIDHEPVATNDSGIYTVPLLQPGHYDITASQPGFATVTHKAVELQVGQTMRVDFEMPVASQQSLVTVTTEAPVLDTEKTELSQNVNENLVDNLPVSSRNWSQFALLTGGVNYDYSTPGGMSFHGINNLYNNNSIDGSNDNSFYNGGARGGTSDYTYSPDSIREFQVTASGINAEVGYTAGGVINSVTKSGTNDFHGDLFYSGRSADFNALDPVAKTLAASKGTAATPSIHQQDQYGGSLGGPLWKNKLFFFTTYDGLRKVNPLTVSTNQLNPSIQNLTCPTLTAAGITNGATAPTAAQCQAAKTMLNTDAIGTFSQQLRQDIELVKIDSQLNQSNHVSGVANIRDWHQANSPLDWATGTDATFYQDRYIIGNWTMLVGTNKVNELRYQYGVDDTFNSLNGSTGMPGVALTGIATYGLSTGANSHTLESINQVTDNFSWTKGAHTFKFGVDVDFIHDQPNSVTGSGGPFTYGSGLSLLPNVACAAPIVSSGQSTANTNNLILCDWMEDLYGDNAMDGRTGQHWQSFGQFRDLRPGVTPQNAFAQTFWDDDDAVYFQDTWKMRTNVTVNAGLRYDVQIDPPFPDSIKNMLAEGELPPGSFDLPILDKYDTTDPQDFGAIQPRLGIAWNVKKKTVLRVSSGLFVAKNEGHSVRDGQEGGAETNTNCATPEVISGASANCAGTLTFPGLFFHQTDGALWTPPLPGAVPVTVQPPTAALVIPYPTFAMKAVDPNDKRPRVFTVNAAVEQQLPGNMNLSISYSYARGTYLPQGVDFNIASNFDPQYCSTAMTVAGQTCNGVAVLKTYDVVNASGVTTTTFTTPFYSAQAPIAAGTGVVALPAFSDRVTALMGVLNGNRSVINSKYDGWIVLLRKPMSHGVELLANYTLSYSNDDGQQGGGNSSEGLQATPAIDPFNNVPEYGRSGTDIRNRFASSVVWTPGFDKYLANNVGKQLVGGWNLSTSITLQSGSAYSGLESGTTAPNVTYTGFTPGSTALSNFVFSPLDGGMGGASTTTPGANAAGRIGWLPPGYFTLPSIYNVDLRLEKQFSIKERYHITVRGEAFNLFNGTLVQAVNENAYSYASPSAAAGTLCPTAAVVGAESPHVNTCMVPLSTFGQPSTTSGFLLGARQLQAGIRFEF